jgi:hypothetical protein
MKIAYEFESQIRPQLDGHEHFKEQILGVDVSLENATALTTILRGWSALPDELVNIILL